MTKATRVLRNAVPLLSAILLSLACAQPEQDVGGNPFVGSSSSSPTSVLPVVSGTTSPTSGGMMAAPNQGGAPGRVNTGGAASAPIPMASGAPGTGTTAMSAGPDGPRDEAAGGGAGAGVGGASHGGAGAESDDPGGAGRDGSGGEGGSSSAGGSGAAPQSSMGGGGNDGGAPGGGGTGGTAEPGGPDASSVFRVSGRSLFDRCGEEVVLRGVNEMIVWSGGKDGVPEYAEIAKTGANSVRIVWTEEGSAAELDAAIANAVAQQLIPMIEHHSATGDLGGVPAVVDYWTRDDVVATLTKHERYLLLNIANEAGAAENQSDFEQTYRQAITRIRDTGVRMPLVIDAPQWGQDIDMLQAAGPALIDHDPEKNLMFSVHMWWHDPNGERVVSELEQSVQQGLPLIVGEFAQHAVSQCANEPFAYTVLLSEAQRHGIGWLAWSWGSVNNSDCANQGSFDMTVGGVFGDWEEPWGQAVALTDPNSIQNTSVRPRSMVQGACESR